MCTYWIDEVGCVSGVNDAAAEAERLGSIRFSPVVSGRLVGGLQAVGRATSISLSQPSQEYQNTIPIHSFTHSLICYPRIISVTLTLKGM